MKLTAKLLICALILLHLAPLPAIAGEEPELFVLPDGHVGQYYQVKIGDVLRQRYNLKLETDGRVSLFRWSFADGEIPSGLSIRPGGIIAGMPRVPREEPYQFRVRVADASIVGGGVLILTLSLKLDTPRIRLLKVEAPRLVPLNKEASAANIASQVKSARSMQAFLSPTSFSLLESQATAQPSSARTNDTQLAASSSPDRQAILNRSEEVNTRSASDADLRSESLSSAMPEGATCAGAPQRPAGKLFIIDARNGETTGKREFEKDDLVKVVIENKNPYLYKYTFTANTRVIEETAIGKFLPLLGGVITDLTADNKAVEDKTKDATQRAKDSNAGDDPNCDDTFKTLLGSLNAEKNLAITTSTNIASGIKTLSRDNKSRKDKYDPLRKVLLNAQSTDADLYCKSKDLLNITDPGADPDKIDGLKKDVEALRVQARSFSVRADILQRVYPTCTNPEEISGIKVAAEGLLALADKYDKSLKTIGDDLKTMDDFKETVDTVSSDPRNFMEVHEFGPYRRTTEVTLGLQRTSLADENAKAQDLVKADVTVLKFGEAPFFSISGGIAFSPLRKREYIRVQGFERDLQGNIVLVGGKPNLTTIVGLKENSPTRIAPLVMLNGRLPHSKMGPIDGWHISLGITGKNDNKGTDIEYLVGPSMSMLEDNLFLTFGGYAGKQQKLGGSLFEGAAVPASVDELPIQKNYRWHFGFALTYKLPFGSK